MENFTHYIIRDYREGDEGGITTLFSEVFGKEMSIEQWKWKYFIPGEGRIYSKVAEDESGKIIGHAGAVPLRGVFQNRAIQFFQIVDVMVHAKARGFLGRKNIFDSLMKPLFEDIGKQFPDVFCYGFPGRRPFILGKRVGVYDEIETAVDYVKHARPSFFKHYRIKTISWNDDGLDTLWTRLSKEFSLSVIRDKRYLLWRYATNPYFSFQLLGFFLPGSLIGWAIIRDLKEEILVLDLLTETKRCKGVLRTLEDYLASLGKKNIRLWLPESWKKHVTDYSTKETPVVVTNMIWKLPVQTSTVRECLYYTMGDTDVF